MGQRNGLDQIFMQLKRTRHGAGQLSHLKRVGESCSKQIAFVVQKNLRFVDQSSKGTGVNDAVSVSLKIISRGCILFIQTPASGSQRIAGKGREDKP